MVLDAGRIVSLHVPGMAICLSIAQVEFGPPAELLRGDGSFFKSLVDASGDKEKLYAMAAGINVQTYAVPSPE